MASRPRPTCPTCHKRVSSLTYRECETCHSETIKEVGELQAVAQKMSTTVEKYVCTDENTVYAHFYRLEQFGDIFVVKQDERQWCLQIAYVDGFPCAPRLAFVNPFDYSDFNPIWWPQTQFKMDPLRKLMDLRYVADRTAYELGYSRGDIANLKPKSEDELSKGRSKNKKPYQDYLSEFWEMRRTLENGTDHDAHQIIRRWYPDRYVTDIAPKILPP